MKFVMASPEFSPTTARELTVFVQNAFQQLQDKLYKTEDSIVKRFNDTGKKIDQIEKCLTELMDHAGVNEPYEDGDSVSGVSDNEEEQEE